MTIAHVGFIDSFIIKTWRRHPSIWFLLSVCLSQCIACTAEASSSLSESRHPILKRTQSILFEKCSTLGFFLMMKARLGSLAWFPSSLRSCLYRNSLCSASRMEISSTFTEQCRQFRRRVCTTIWYVDIDDAINEFPMVCLCVFRSPTASSLWARSFADLPGESELCVWQNQGRSVRSIHARWFVERRTRYNLARFPKSRWQKSIQIIIVLFLIVLKHSRIAATYCLVVLPFSSFVYFFPIV